MYALRAFPALVLGLLLLGGCTELRAVGEATGVVASEENVESNAVNARLSLPPDFNLRPPQPGSGVAQARAATSRGRQAIVGDKRKTESKTRTLRQANRSAGESALLKRASGNQSVERNIRRMVDAETVGDAEAKKKFTDKLLKWREPPEETDGEEGSRPAPGVTKSTPVITKK